MPFKIVRNDITKMKVDAIVNTANEAPVYSTGTDMAVYMAAGPEKLLEARRRIGHMKQGEVAITPAFQLPAQYIIHAVSPRYINGKSGEEEKLRSCYEKCLKLAVKYKCKSIAFPLISTGNFGYPKEDGMEIATSVICSFLMKRDMMVYLVVFDQESWKLSGQLFQDIESYIDDNYVDERNKIEYDRASLIREDMVYEARSFSMNQPIPCEAARPTERKKLSKKTVARSLDDLMNHMGETFQQQLFRLIDEKGRTDVDVYKRAGKDKKFFHKIRINTNYQPTKHTVFAFGLSLELSLDEVIDLLARAGYAISPSSKFDLIMRYVFEHKIYDIYQVDCILYDFGETHFFGCEK